MTRLMSEKQEGFIKSLIAQKQADDILIDAATTAADASAIIEKLMAMKDANATAVIEGQQKVTGVIVKTDVKLYGGHRGFGIDSRMVMTVLDDRGFKVWGTQPSAIAHARNGDRIEFIATLEQSDRDESFGFFKRPKAAKILNDIELEAAA